MGRNVPLGTAREQSCRSPGNAMFDADTPAGDEETTEPPPPEDAAAGGRVLQLGDHQEAVQDVESWLLKWEEEHDTEETKRARRLLADQELLTQLQIHRFQGRRWDLFADALSRYAYPVMRSWIRDDSIWRRVREKQRTPITLHRYDFTGPQGTEDADDLVTLLIGECLENFRQYVLIGQRWDPRYGASIRTYFVGNILLRFPTIYGRWRSEQFDGASQAYPPADLPDSGHDLGPARRVVAGCQIDEAVMTTYDERERRIIAMTALSYSQAEIAAELGMTRKAIERTVARFRRRAG